MTISGSNSSSMSRPRVSVTMNRLRPLIFLPASSACGPADGVGAFHALGVDDPRRRLLGAAVGHPQPAAHG
jgi:hypothetical protein